MNWVAWLDQTLGPPWSGLVVLGVFGLLASLSGAVGVQTVLWGLEQHHRRELARKRSGR